jgi:DNA-binding GntR family transcriptional regulator
VQKTGNAQMVYTSLRNSILSLNLVPGTAINEKDISVRYNVSRTPVREAFITLSKEALITVMPQKGSMVSCIDLNRVKQEQFLRESLETAALRLFIKEYDSVQLAELEKCIDLQIEACESRKPELFNKLDDQFHRIFFGSQNVAWEAMENTCGHYHRIRLLTIWIQGIIADIIEEHKKIFDAVKQRDTEKSLSHLNEHIHKLSSEEALLKRFFPDYFTDSGVSVPEVDFGGLKV